MFKKKRKLPKYKFSYGKSLNTSSSFHKPTGHQRIKKKRPSLFSGRLKKLLQLTLIGSGLGIFSYIFFFSNQFTIRSIHFSEDNFQSGELNKQIEKELKSAIGKSIFFINISDYENQIAKHFPELEKIEISKNYPDILEINPHQYPLAANIINESPNLKKSFIINSIGYVIKENIEKQGLPYIKIISDEPINPKENLIPVAKLNYILEAKKYFEDKFGMKIIDLEYKKVARELHLHTEKDFYIWLDIETSYEDQLKKLKKALVKLDIHKESLLYIDLRIAGNNGDKIIYKRK